MRLIIPGQPKAQKRHRTGTNGNRYDPSKKDKKNIQKHLLQIKPAEPIEGPICVTITAFFQTPESWSNRQRIEYEGIVRPKKPDIDNIAKIYYDAMNGMIFKDDSQVVRSEVTKCYSANPCTVIEIDEAINVITGVKK